MKTCEDCYYYGSCDLKPNDHILTEEECNDFESMYEEEEEEEEDNESEE